MASEVIGPSLGRRQAGTREGWKRATLDALPPLVLQERPEFEPKREAREAGSLRGRAARRRGGGDQGGKREAEE